MLKFGDDIGSDESDRRQFRSDTSLRFVTFWPGVTRCCYLNNHTFIMRKDNVGKVTLLVQYSLGIIM